MKFADKRADVLIVGAGPSGLRVAGRLAAAGFSVRIIERKPAVGQNVLCTGIVSQEVFEKYELDPGSILREVRSVQLVSPFASVVTYQHPRSFAYVVDRQDFDSRLAATAQAAGASIDLECAVEDISVDDGGVKLMAKRNRSGPISYTAPVAVIASGVDYGLQKKAGLDTPRDFLVGAQAELPADADDITTVFFGRGIAPGAFAWSVPAGHGKARVGLLTKKDPKACLLKFIEANRPRWLAAFEESGIRTKAVAQGLLARTSADRVLAVGEAAGQVKTTTGGGISYGLLCADLAAEAIIECFKKGSFSASALAAYESGWKKAIQKEIVIGYYTRKMCARLSDGQIEGLFQLAKNDGIIPIIRETADFDWHSGLITALLERLSFMRFFRNMKDTLGRGSPS
jgi:geranylgeranyl reductase family protein